MEDTSIREIVYEHDTCAICGKIHHPQKVGFWSVMNESCVTVWDFKNDIIDYVCKGKCLRTFRLIHKINQLVE